MWSRARYACYFPRALARVPAREVNTGTRAKDMWLTDADTARALAARVAAARAEIARARRMMERERARERVLKRALVEILTAEYGADEAPYAAMAFVAEAEDASATEEVVAGRPALFG